MKIPHRDDLLKLVLELADTDDRAHLRAALSGATHPVWHNNELAHAVNIEGSSSTIPECNIANDVDILIRALERLTLSPEEDVLLEEIKTLRERLYPHNLDPEVVELVRAMNRLPGILTDESCAGHGRRPLQIWFHVPEHGRGLLTLARVTCRRYYEDGWRVLLFHGDLPHHQVSYVLEGTAKDADRLARVINEHVDGTTGTYNILTDRVDPCGHQKSSND